MMRGEAGIIPRVQLQGLKVFAELLLRHCDDNYIELKVTWISRNVKCNQDMEKIQIDQ